MVDFDLNLIHEFVNQKFESIRQASSDIFNEYLETFQKRMTSHCLSVLNLDQGFASPNASNIFKKKTRLESNDFLNYKILHSDMKALVKFMNENLKLKTKFLAETMKGGTQPNLELRNRNKIPLGDKKSMDYIEHVPVTEYMKMFKSSVDNLYRYEGEVVEHRRKQKI